MSQATFPPGAGREDVPAMLRTLLEERFGLVARVETRPVDVYELVVGASDRTLVEVDPFPDLPDVRRLAPTERVNENGDLAISLDAASALRVRTSDQALYSLKLSSVRGAALLDAERMTMEQLASTLRSIVDKPVIDRTGLTAAYRFTLEIPSPGAGRGGVTTARDGTPILPEPSGVDVFRSLERLRLKLQAQRSPIEMVVIEKIERAPTEN